MTQSSFYSCNYKTITIVLHSQVLSYDINMRKCTVCPDLFSFSGIILAGFPHRILPQQEGGLNVVIDKGGVLPNRVFFYLALCSARGILHCKVVI